MAIIVQKFGGSSLGSLERIKLIAQRAIKARQRGDNIVVVVSAMAGETNRLIQLAKALSAAPSPREYANLVTTGETVSMALMAMCIIEQGFEACSYSGSQLPIITNSDYLNAQVLRVETARIKEELAAGKIVVVGGFQGLSEQGQVTTLGRSGSDMTAISVAAALGAKECQIFTDVEGVFTADPKLVPLAGPIAWLSYAQLLAISQFGAKVVQSRAVLLAKQKQVALRVLSSFGDENNPGTLISQTLAPTPLTQGESSSTGGGVGGNGGSSSGSSDQLSSQPSLKEDDLPKLGLTYQLNQTLLKVTPQHHSSKEFMSALVQSLHEQNIPVDSLVKNEVSGKIDSLHFTVGREVEKAAETTVHNLSSKLGKLTCDVVNDLAKVTVVGLNSKNINELLEQVKVALANAGIQAYLLDFDESRVSVFIDEEALARSLCVLHSYLGMDVPPKDGQKMSTLV